MSNTVNPYGAQRILAGMKYLLLGKAMAAIGGIGGIWLLIRELSVEEFAAYSVMFGLVEILLSCTTVGTVHIINRFVPELFQKGYATALRRVLIWTLVVRFAVLLATLTGCWLLVSVLADSIGLAQWQTALSWYLLVVLFRTTNNTLSPVLEAMLHQRGGQISFAAITTARFLGFLVLFLRGELTLMAAIWVEIAAEVLGMVLMSGHLHQAVNVQARQPTDSAQAQRDWVRDNLRRMIGFGMKGYTQHMVLMPYSGMVNRLVMGGTQVSALQMALFGFAQSIFDQIQRYLPAQLFVGVIRPVMAARWSASGNIAEASLITNVTLRINLALIGGVIICILWGGAPMLLELTNQKYGAEAVSLLLIMCGLLALESWRHVLDILSHTVERYGFLIFSNILLGASLGLGIVLLPTLGITALPVANCVGVLLANLLLFGWLRRTGIAFRHDLKGVAQILLALGVSVGAHAAMASGTLPATWLMRVLVGGGIYMVILGALLWRDQGVRTVLQMIRSRRAAGAA